MSYLFLPRYQLKCVIKFLFIQLMMSKTISFMLDQPLKQWLTRRKRGEDRNTKIWIPREGKELFRWNEKHFYTPPWSFFTFFKLYECHQIAERIISDGRYLKSLKLSVLVTERKNFFMLKMGKMGHFGSTVDTF